MVSNAIVTNIHLNRYGIKETAKCTFCKTHDETTIHLFVHCEEVIHKIWLPLKQWLYYYCNVEFNIEAYEILFNKYADSFSDLINTIILIAKQFIYATRCLDEKLSFPALISKISQHCALEGIVAKKNKTLRKYRRKWHMYFIV